MQRLTSRRTRVFPRSRLSVAAGLVAGAAAGCAGTPPAAPATSANPTPSTAAEVVIDSPAGRRVGEAGRPPFRFSKEDERLLDDIQRGAFWFLWNQACPTTGMVVDRSSVDFASIAGVGFQLAALPIGVERGWVTRDQAQTRAVTILTALEANPDNRKAGLFYHFLKPTTAGPVPQDVVSTIDSALFFAGAMVASTYFGGDVQARADRLFAQADWTFFVETAPRPHEQFMKGFISLGWKPDSFDQPTGRGSLQPYYWADNGDEHRLVCFLAAAAPDPRHRVGADLYYRLRRPLGEYKDAGTMVYLPWSGALFTSFFAHCFMDYRSRGPDDPAAFGIPRRPRVDWWENSRRQVNLHRLKAREAADRFPTLGENAWGLTACDVPDGYGVPGVYPNPLRFPELVPGVDDAQWTPKDDYANGTLGCYGAGCAIMFEPEAALAALRHYRSLQTADGSPLVWREPSSDPTKAHYGFLDSFNSASGWVAKDYVAIDQGPLILAIENARTGSVWKWFEAHPAARAAWQRLGMPENPQNR
jgi:hypothetical protein